ncbi:MAG: 50S ribosomal protein L4 [Candidatus Margulisbacteria bacterium]|nr:50S ribosomal protein L4 [Candidatus Margulisiibacteriota bacterium]MBU1022106.1 50S ribosomal protein L4 [Candidatus Margulisiibacteriota bacterium]MBU1729701.1 50S ribosomal protein L4 [Candidatus Margulisiibacteriota bacterium]MBU1955021.1 50S ribosomal protein L4 [Candidatus Margulisiibacteriota bacterium]
MGQIQVVDAKGQAVSKLDVKDEVFAVVPKEAVVHSALVAHTSNLRQGNASTKSRGMVRGGGKKPWKQKGTGRARAGTSRSPLWRGGGVIFGPSPRKYTNRLPKKIRKLAVRMVLSEKLAQNKIKVLDEIKVTGKTKEMYQLINALGLKGKILILLNAENQLARRSAQNINKVEVRDEASVNIFDLLNCDEILSEKTVLKKVEEALA